jgi:hypothetical protein
VADRSAVRSPVAIVVLRCSAIVIGLSLLYAILPFQTDYWLLGLLIGGAAVGATVPITIRRVRRVLASDRPILDAAEALVLLVTTLVIGFSAVYLTMNRADGQFAGISTRFDAIYFTVVTLGTVGYGDVTATGQAARMAVTIQIAFDFALLGVAVRVLTAAARHRLDHGSEPSS